MAGCFTNVTCNVSATDGREVELTAYIAIGQERRPVPKAGAKLFAFPAVEYGQHLYEIRADGKPLIFGFLLVRPSAFPVAQGTVDYTLNATLDSVDALHVDIELTPGPRGYSAYEVAVMEGFVGSEAEWLEHMRQQTATMAVERVTPLMERAETAADKSEREAAAAKTEQETAAAHAKAAKESELAAAEKATAAAGKVTAAAAEVEKAKLERETAAAHAEAAAKSAQDAMTNQQGAEQAAQDAAQAQAAAETAKADADAAKLAAQTAETNAKASANAAAADKAAAETAKTQAQAAQSKAEQEAQAAADNAALLGDAALQSGNNTFSGENNLTGSLSLAGNPAQAAEEMAYWPIAVQAFMVQAYDWSQCKNDFKKLTKPWRFPSDMPEPEQIRTTANMRFWFHDLTFTHLPDSWTFEGLTTIFETFSGNRQLRAFPVGVTFSNVTYFSFGLNECSRLKLSETMDFSNATSVIGAFRNCAAIEKLPESLTCKNIVNISEMCSGCKNLRTVSQALDLSGVQGGNTYLNENCARLAFQGCQLEKESALRVLNTIGEVKAEYREGHTFPLHIGIHVDHQTDEEVLAAIDAATAKGWTVSLQWNGTPTASTFALRPAPPMPVYAKLNAYTDAEGNEWPTLDWCHQVSSPEGKTPEALGYTLFESVEAAREYYNLPEPEEPETAYEL